jgi:hypothetical protein
MYEIKTTGEQIPSFTAACKAGQAAKSEVIEVSTGIRRWAPVELVSAKKMRIYNERMQAYKTQQATK